MMQRFWRVFAVMTAVILAGSSPLHAHEECDDTSSTRSVAAAGDQSVGPRSQAGSVVMIQLFQYQPGRLEIKAGTTVTWINQDEIQHTVTLGTPEDRNGAVSLSLPGKGVTASFTFDLPGEYEYFCERHQSMRGQIHVQ
jgi:plastocyanin